MQAVLMFAQFYVIFANFISLFSIVYYEFDVIDFISKPCDLINITLPKQQYVRIVFIEIFQNNRYITL